MDSNIFGISRMTGGNSSPFDKVSDISLRKRKELEDIAAEALGRVIENASFDVKVRILYKGKLLWKSSLRR
jgi:hypothetical protein